MTRSNLGKEVKISRLYIFFSRQIAIFNSRLNNFHDFFSKVQDPLPSPANKQTLEKPDKMSSPQRSDKSPPPTVGKRKSSDKPKRSLQIQLEKLTEPFLEKASEPLPKPTPKSSTLDADQKLGKLEESKVILFLNLFFKRDFEKIIQKKDFEKSFKKKILKNHSEKRFLIISAVFFPFCQFF